MNKFLPIGVIVFILLLCLQDTHAAPVSSISPTISGKVSLKQHNNEGCFWWGPVWYDVCLYTQSFTMLIADTPRTIQIIEDGAKAITEAILEIIDSPAKVKELLETAIAVPIDTMILRRADITKAHIQDASWAIENLLYIVEMFTESATFDQWKRVLVSPIGFLIKSSGSVVTGVKRGLLESGWYKAGRLVHLIEHQLKNIYNMFDEYVVYPEVVCTDVFAGAMCEKMATVLKKILNVFWSDVHKVDGLFKRLKDMLLKRVEAMSFQHVVSDWERYCQSLGPGGEECRRILNDVKGLDSFALVEEGKIKKAMEAAKNWIKTHIFVDMF